MMRMISRRLAGLIAPARFVSVPSTSLTTRAIDCVKTLPPPCRFSGTTLYSTAGSDPCYHLTIIGQVVARRAEGNWTWSSTTLPDRIVIGIARGSASGKSTLTQGLTAALQDIPGIRPTTIPAVHYRTENVCGSSGSFERLTERHGGQVDRPKKALRNWDIGLQTAHQQPHSQPKQAQ